MFFSGRFLTGRTVGSENTEARKVGIQQSYISCAIHQASLLRNIAPPIQCAGKKIRESAENHHTMDRVRKKPVKQNCPKRTRDISSVPQAWQD